MAFGGVRLARRRRSTVWRWAFRRSLFGGLVGLAAGLAGQGAGAAEVITYAYDALGRLVQVDQKNGTAGTVTTVNQIDFADNRSTVTVTGAPTNTPGGGQAVFVVVPLNGYTLIKIN